MRYKAFAWVVVVFVLSGVAAYADEASLNDSEALSPEQLEAAYRQAWVQIGERYYQPDALKDWASWEKRFAGKLKTEGDLDAALAEMVSSLGDRWTRYFGLGDTLLKDVDRAGGCVDIGISVTRANDATYAVAYLQVGSVAYRSGLRKGDELKSVNSKALVGLSLVDVERMMCAQPHSRVELVITRGGAQSAITLVARAPEPRKVEAKLLPGQVLYVLLPQFDSDSVVAFEDAIVAVLKQTGNNLSAVVLDFRGNPGGDVELTVDVAALFMRSGPVLQYYFREGRKVQAPLVQLAPPLPFSREDDPDLVLQAASLLYDKPIVVLTDESTASSAEVVAVALRENRGARLVGTTTWGKAVAYTDETLKNGATVRITIGRMRSPSGFDWSGHGLVPDLPVEQPLGAREDVQLKAALDLLEP